MKRCVRCQATKAAEAFRAMRGMRDGLDSWCRECHREYSRAHSRRAYEAKTANRAAAQAERAARSALARQVAAWEREAVRVSYGACAACGATFAARRSDKRYCSERCTPAYANQAARMREYSRRRGHPSRPKAPRLASCLHCGQRIEGTRRQFCSNRCVARHWRTAGNVIRRLRDREAYIEHVDRDAVFERDAWTCHLCGLGVDRQAQYLDPLAPTLDHVIPIARGGTHEYANVRTAHRRCNVAKGARVGVAA